MSSRNWSTALLRFTAILVFVGVTTFVLLALQGQTAPPIVALGYLLPVLASALAAGWIGGMLASLLSFLAFNYFFLPPYRTFVVDAPGDPLVLATFLAVAGLVSYLLGRARAETERALQRQQELTVLYELSKAVTAQSGLDAMLQAIAERVSAAFDGQRCEIWLKPPGELLQRMAQSGAVEDPGRKATEFLISSDREPLGILKLFATRELRHGDRLLLTAVAAHSALVIERARLTQTATRARVLEESDRIKGALLSSISHDLRTPLATIKAAVTGLLRRDLAWTEEALVDQLNAVSEETDRLNRVIGNLLSMSRLEAGAVQLDRREYILSDLIDTVLERMGPRARGRTIRLSAPADLPPVSLDYGAFEQILTNLLDNALKYSPAGTDIEVAARAVGRFAEISVADRGPGIPEQDRQAVFDKFYRVNGGSQLPGSGLGLSIVRGFVEAHGGKAWISSKSGEGTRVSFLLPLAHEPERTE